MTVTIVMPEVAETVVEGTIARWMKQEGDQVAEYEPIVEVITDKVNVEVPSPVAGVLKQVLAQPNAVVKIGEPLAIIEAEAGSHAPPSSALPRPAAERAPAAPPAPAAPGIARHYSPIVQHLAEEHRIDLRQVTGTGIGGRITRRDVEAYIAKRGAAPPQPPTAPAGGGPSEPKPRVSVAKDLTPPAPAPKPADGEVVPLSPVRGIIARRMAQSRREVPDAWTMTEVDVTGLVRLRTSLREEFQRKEGINLTYLPFAIKAVVAALKEFPIMNSVWAGDRLIMKKAINMSVAIDRDEGLAVPVIHRADQHSIAGLAREVRRLSELARSGKLKIEDVQGGAFTIDNTGVFGSVLSQPIVNQPQIAILTTEAIVRRPVVTDNDAIAIRFMMNICISFDHRAVDGAIVGRFMQSVRRNLEAYGPGQHVW